VPKAFNDISTRRSVGLFWVQGNSGVRGNEIADSRVIDGIVLFDQSWIWGFAGRIYGEDGG
jgi:hypothetical protein